MYIYLQNWRRNYGSVVSSSIEYVPENDDHGDITKEKLSKAAKAYLERAQKYDDMISEAKAEYRVGMRHLANMMGENPETFTQADANVYNNHAHSVWTFEFSKIIYLFQFAGSCRVSISIWVIRQKGTSIPKTTRRNFSGA